MFTLSYPCIGEEKIFYGHFSEKLVDLDILKSEFQKCIVIVCLCAYVCVFVYVYAWMCFPDTSLTTKSCSRNSKFGFLHFDHMSYHISITL